MNILKKIYQKNRFGNIFCITILNNKKFFIDVQNAINDYRIIGSSEYIIGIDCGGGPCFMVDSKLYNSNILKFTNIDHFESTKILRINGELI